MGYDRPWVMTKLSQQTYLDRTTQQRTHVSEWNAGFDEWMIEIDAPITTRTRELPSSHALLAHTNLSARVTPLSRPGSRRSNSVSSPRKLYVKASL